MAFFYEADPPVWYYKRSGYGGQKVKFPNAIAKKMERLFQKTQRNDSSEVELLWTNKADSKEYKINVRSYTMEEQNSHSSYRYHSYGNYDVSREGYPYPKYGNKQALKKSFQKFKTGEDRIELENPRAFFEWYNINGENIDGLIFHAIAKASGLFEFNIDSMADNFAQIGCTKKGDINGKIQDMKNTLLGTKWSGLNRETKLTRKKQMKKLAKQLFEICTMGRKGVRELPFIPRESEEEEVKGAEDSDEESEGEPLYLPLMYNLLYIQNASRFPLAGKFCTFIEGYLKENKKFGLTWDEWENVAEFLFTETNPADTDPDGWPTLIEAFILDCVGK